MNTRYYDLSTEQKLALTSEELSIATNLESAERGIAIPLNLAEFIQQQGYVGHQIPLDAVGFYQLMAPKNYGGHQATGICFKTEEEALNALEGAICIIEDGYGATAKNKFITDDFAVQKTFIVQNKAHQFVASIKEYEEEREPYDTLCKEIADDLRQLRQRKYDSEVIAAKKVKYLELANGNEETAKRFWNNIEKCDWPE